jgi:leucyl/phenylalanyl-tRNA--protein transferase
MSRLKIPVGPDPDFPYLGAEGKFQFPDPENCADDIVAFGGNLSPGMLLSAYEQGIFPWFNPQDPVIWQSPRTRFIITPDTLHISTTMQKIFKRRDFEIRFDYDFPQVIKTCSLIKREGQGGTWITADMISAYNKLHRLGYAHSAESYVDGELAGACYGILLGKIFFGESMFSKKSNASKAAFLSYAQKLFTQGVKLIDCQVPTDHLASMGGREIDRKDFLKLVKNLARR